MAIKYKWLAGTLRDLIKKDVKNQINKLPSEQELCRRYHVSRQTVRQALNLLTQEDYQTMLQNEMHEYEQFSRRIFFEKVLEGKMSVKEIYDEAAKLEMELTASSYNLIFIYLQEHRKNQSELEVEQFLRQQEEILHYFLRCPQYQVFRWNVNCYGVLIKSDQDNVEKETDKALDYVRKICEKALEKMDWYVAAPSPRLA